MGDYFGYYTDADFREAGERWLNVNYDVAYRSFDDGAPVWISKEDGHAYAMTRYDDLRFLELVEREGIICSRLDRLTPGYLMDVTLSGESILTPVWHIETDTVDLYLNALTGLPESPEHTS